MILREANFSNIITELKGEGANKKLYLKGVMMMAESQNRNGRVYPRSEIEKAVAKLNESIRNGEDILGELDHPNTLEISLRNVSHKIENITMEGDNAVGKALILDTPAGEIAKQLIKSGVRFGVSSRGSGHVNESTGLVENFDIVTIDLVATPSAQNAYPVSVFEGLKHFQGYAEMVELAKHLKEDKTAQKYFQRNIEQYIREMFKK